MLVKLYRKYVSKGLRDKIYKAFLGSYLQFYRNFWGYAKSKYNYWFQRFLPDTEKNRAYAFMGKYGLTLHPYLFSLEYKKMPISCFFDEQLKMYYVIYSGKKLYFPKSYSEKETVRTYKDLLIEQDCRSPHQYVKDINRLKGKTLLDVGAAEALFSLAVIELANYVYIFECDENWVEALTATFNPWKNKVTIIRKYVSDINDENNITVDHFLEGKEKTNLFLKMDIEGCESAALKGASNTLKESPDIDFAICTYHRKEDAKEIAKMFRSYHLESEQTDGYLFNGNELRKAMLRRKYT